MIKTLFITSTFFFFHGAQASTQSISGMTHSTFKARTRHMYKERTKHMHIQPKHGTALKNLTPNSHSHIYAFKNKEGLVTQAAVEHYGCYTRKLAPIKKEIVISAQNEIKALTYELLNSSLMLNQYRLSQKDFDKVQRVSSYTNPFPKLKHPLVKRVRLQKNIYKCDGRSGLGYRFDIFFKVAR